MKNKPFFCFGFHKNSESIYQITRSLRNTLAEVSTLRYGMIKLIQTGDYIKVFPDARKNVINTMNVLVLWSFIPCSQLVGIGNAHL